MPTPPAATGTPCSAASRAIVTLVAIVVAALACGRLAPAIRSQLAAPFDLISEGPHLSTVKAIRAGQNIYDPVSYQTLPYSLTPYTPPYHLLVAALPQDPENPFFTGRLVATVFMAGAAVAVLAVGWTLGNLAVAVLALGLFFLVHPVTGNTAYLRSDNLALVCAVWSIVVLYRAGAGGIPSRRAVDAAALLAAAAVAGKHSFTAAALAGFLWLLVRSRRLAARYAVVGALAGLVLALAAWITWGDGFWFCVTLPLTAYPRDWESFWGHLRMMTDQPVFLALLAVAAAGLLLAWRQPGRPRAATGLVLLYALVAWGLQGAVMTGIGAENHNLIEPLLATALWITVAVPSGSATLAGTAVGVLALAAVLGAVLVELRSEAWRTWSYTTPAFTAEYVRQRADVTAAIERLGLPGRRFMNLKNSQIAHDFDADIVVNDPFMFVMLWDTGTVSTEPLLDALAAKTFDAVLVAPTLFSGKNQRRDHPTQHVIITIFEHYRLAIHSDLINVLTRRP